LHADHRYVVRDDIVQLARDPGPLTARGVLEQIAGSGPSDRSVCLRLGARCLSDSGERRGRRETCQQPAEYPGFRAAGNGMREQQHEKDERQAHGQGLCAGSGAAGASQPVSGEQLREEPGDGQGMEQHERRRACGGDRGGGRRGGEE
jgi:hypothetical protein